MVTIDVQHRRFHHLEHIGAVQRSVIARIGGGEADLVVHHKVHRAAGTVAALCEKQRVSWFTP